MGNLNWNRSRQKQIMDRRGTEHHAGYNQAHSFRRRLFTKRTKTRGPSPTFMRTFRSILDNSNEEWSTAELAKAMADKIGGSKPRIMSALVRYANLNDGTGHEHLSGYFYKSEPEPIERYGKTVMIQRNIWHKRRDK
jgi:hypothetical protein